MQDNRVRRAGRTGLPVAKSGLTEARKLHARPVSESVTKTFIQFEFGRFVMLYYALMFLVVALLAGLLGFTGVALAAAGIAKIVFFIFLVLFVVSLITHAARRV